MLKGTITHPGLIHALAACGHGDKILVADGNYPLHTNTHDEASRIYLNLTHGIPLVTDVLQALQGAIAIEKAEVMVPETGVDVPVFSVFRSMLGRGTEWGELGRHAFYEACQERNVKVAIATGEQRIYANVLLTVGVVQAD